MKVIWALVLAFICGLLAGMVFGWWGLIFPLWAALWIVFDDLVAKGGSHDKTDD